MPGETIGNDVMAIIRSEMDVQEAVLDLKRNGFERDEIRVYHPHDAEERLDSAGEHSGFLGKIARSVQGALSDEYKLLEEYEEAAQGGAEVVAVHAESQEEVERARDILLSHNGENIRHFGNLVVTDLQDQGRASS